MAAFNQDDMIQMERRQLTLQRIGAATSLGSTTRDSIKLRSLEDQAINGLVMELQADVLADKIAGDTYKAQYEYKIPANAWQHLKSDKAPRWFKKRFPVRFEKYFGSVEVKFTRLATYPKANVALQGDQPFFIDVLGGHESLRDVVEQVR